MDSSPDLSARPDALDAVLLLLHHGRVLVGLPFALVALVVGGSLLLPRDFTASATFAPESASNSLGQFAGVAAQLGVALPAQQAYESADFYADLLRSRDVLAQLVHSRYASGARGDSAGQTLIDLYGIRGGDSARLEDRAIRRLARSLSVSVKSKTGVVRFEVTTRSAALSEGIAVRALEVVNQFNLQRRQSRAGAQRRFVEARLADAETDLRGSEDRLQSWLQQNRDFKDSPRLTFEYQRRQNEMALKQGVVTTLAQAFEQARIDEVRDTPVLTVVEDPVVPSRPDSRRILAKGTLAIILGFGLAALAAALRENLRRLRRERPEHVSEAGRLLRGLFGRRS